MEKEDCIGRKRKIICSKWPANPTQAFANIAKISRTVLGTSSRLKAVYHFNDKNIKIKDKE